MLKISRMTDYGLLLLTQVAKRPGELHTARELAAVTQLPGPTVSKILKILTREGILRSHRGVAGGYNLAAEPADISMADVVIALEGPIAIVQCSEAPGLCDLEANCSTRTPLKIINEAITDALQRVTLATINAPQPSELITLGGRNTAAAATPPAPTPGQTVAPTPNTHPSWGPRPGSGGPTIRKG